MNGWDEMFLNDKIMFNDSHINKIVSQKRDYLSTQMVKDWILK